MTRRPPRILLVQARDPGDPMLAHERDCFARRSGLPAESLRPVNILHGLPSEADVQWADAIFAGGSGDYSVVGDGPAWIGRAAGWMARIAHAGPPVFASCFGVQLLAVGLGGSVIHDPAGREVGTYPLNLTSAGRADPLFGTLPPRFHANCGHHDRVAEPPSGAVVLASSEACPVQAFKLDGRPVYATQFHPELDLADMNVRVRRYADNYLRTDDERREFRKWFGPTSPEVDDLLRAFVARHAGAGRAIGEGAASGDAASTSA